MGIATQANDGSLALLTDFYQLTMAYGYWQSGIHNREAVFHHSFRRSPFKGGFAVAAGLDLLIDYLENFRFTSSDISFLESQKIFPADFLEFLGELKFSCDVEAVPEGTVVFPYEPLIRVKGPLLQCQILETVILNLINFQTLIATKAARLRIAAGEDSILEFGLRRAQGIDGALNASRAAFVGGCNATSNVLAGKLYGIPVKGTHAHSWVMVFDEELEAFETYAKVLPDLAVFLVDTYNTLNGVRNAIQVGKRLREMGKDLLGIRLDSGDLSYLSIEARKLLDASGFQNTEIFASNDLDEHVLSELKKQGAQITVWGVGTRLATASDQPALDGVYKLSALKNADGEWEDRIKLSEQMSKVSNPGFLQVRRYFNNKENVCDVIYDECSSDLSQGCTIIDPLDPTRERHADKSLSYRDLLVSVFKKGDCVYKRPTLIEIQENTKRELSQFHPGVKRFLNAHQYPVGMEAKLYEKKVQLIKQLRRRYASVGK